MCLPRQLSRDSPAVSDDEAGQLSQGYNRMVESLRSMKGDFKALAENAHDATFIVTFDGEILFANARTAAVTGIPAEELPGMCFEAFMAESEAATVLRRLLRTRP